ncbi:hypothetical protein E3N88_34947 [Mikania micrantha]|uniref:Uncharacterized protein n=1 Tax=Mikania micrantha TaxID=192012 RepID=A0A5N6LZK7_9ASTR|nr:hypothetical protein E3N88_34947 [Mikania micrantha]
MADEVTLIATALEDTKVLVRLNAFTPILKTKANDNGSTSSGLDGLSILRRHKSAPIYLPRFSRTHPERWVAQANRYFEFYSIADPDRLTIASFYLDDIAADWYDWMCHHNQIGLRADVKQSVVIHQPTTVDEAMKYAQLHETRLQLEKGMGRVSLNPSSKPILPNPKSVVPSTPLVPAPTSVKPSSTTNLIGFRRLTPAESAQKHSQGLCYKCDEKHTTDHKCRPSPQLLFFDESPVEVKHQSAISYNALAGGNSPSTLRFTGLVKGKPVQVLLDGGSTHCFVQTRVAKFLNLVIESITPFSVLVGSGEQLPYSGIVKNVELTIQNSPITVDFYVLPLKGWDMVLGVSWLSQLAPVVTNYAKASFEFHSGDTLITWHREQKPIIQSPQLEYHSYIKVLLEEFAQLFQPPTGPPPVRSQDHDIVLSSTASQVVVLPYRYPHFQKQEIDSLVKEMLAQGIIRPSTSPFSSPVLLVRKKDGTWRFCVDYRALHALTVRDIFPIPTIDELFDELHGAQFFFKLDLLAGYHQIRLQEGAIAKTAFHTHGHYEFLVANQQVAKLSKILFGQQKVSYRGHLISAHGLEVDPSKIACIQQWPVPSSVKDVRSFLGLAGYYRRSIKNFASIAGPLTDLLKCDAFKWTSQTATAFQNLQHLLSSTPVLHFPDFSKSFTIETDASDTGIGAVLSQDGHPVAYYSQKSGPRMQHASAYQREMYAITQALSKWRQYLLGRRFQISPISNLCAICKIRPGKHNGAADALSRVNATHFLGLSREELSIIVELRAATLARAKEVQPRRSGRIKRVPAKLQD